MEWNEKIKAYSIKMGRIDAIRSDLISAGCDASDFSDMEIGECIFEVRGIVPDSKTSTRYGIIQSIIDNWVTIRDLVKKNGQ